MKLCERYAPISSPNIRIHYTCDTLNTILLLLCDLYKYASVCTQCKYIGAHLSNSSPRFVFPQSTTLHFVVLSFDRYSRDDVIGEVLCPMSGVQLSEQDTTCELVRDITPRSIKVGQGDRRAGGQTDRRADGQTYRQTERRADGWTDRRAGGQAGRRVDGQAD